MEVKELVQLIHEASSDDNIVALYGDFGDGMDHNFEIGGLAHVEEVRRAIRVFHESHRVHYEPHTGMTKPTPSWSNPKQTKYSINWSHPPKRSVAYAQSFSSIDSKGNLPYLIASSFGEVMMQHQGSVHLFGVGTSTTFLRGFLDKYGLKAHVFKHGDYKNAPNMFTHKKYNKPHLEATKKLVNSLDEQVCDMINDSRFLSAAARGGSHGTTGSTSTSTTFNVNGSIKINKDPLTEASWKKIRAYGPLSASNATELGLIEHEQQHEHETPLTRSAVLEEWTASPEKETGAKHGESKLQSLLSLSSPRPQRQVSLMQYASTVAKRQKKAAKEDQQQWIIHSWMKKASRTPFNAFLEGLGILGPNFNISKEIYDQQMPHVSEETIAIIHIKGGITSSTANELVSTLNQIKTQNKEKKEKDSKNNTSSTTPQHKKVSAVILRVDSPGGSASASEHILMELNALTDVHNVPVVCSMGNVAASGGYYVAAHAHKIFALPTTVTGSIGVYGIKLDATKMAKEYGIHVDFYTKGPHSMGLSPFAPLTKETKLALERTVGDIYDWFKVIVATGRQAHIDIESPRAMEALAQGKVYTGLQAKEVGLVDELGGLDRAIAYTQKHLTVSGRAQVKVYPEPEPLWSRVMNLLNIGIGGGGEKTSTLAMWMLMQELLVGETYTRTVTSQDGNHTREVGGSGSWMDLLSPKGVAYLLSDQAAASSGGVIPMMTMDENEALKATLQELQHNITR
jgi:signal peptide peptidase SppA